MASIATVINIALSEIGKPYVWGGNGPSDFDCSGLMCYAFQHGAGITLPRTTEAMIADPNLISVNKNQLQPGDLVFPESGHVQMYLGGGKIVEAPRPGLNVRISTLGNVAYARRVPGVGTASGTFGSGISDTTPAGTATDAGVVTDAIGGIASTIGSAIASGLMAIIKPIYILFFEWFWWGSEVLIGLALIILGFILLFRNAGAIGAIGTGIGAMS